MDRSCSSCGSRCGPFDDVEQGETHMEASVRCPYGGSMIVRALTGAIVIGSLGLVIGAVGVAPADACSRAAPPLIGEFVPGRPLPDSESPDSVIVGVYEQQHIAGSPGLIVISPRTVSIVTRYWGTPPANVGLQLHGAGLGVLGASSCGNQAGEVGLIGYNWVDQNDLDQFPDTGRPLPSIDIRQSVDGFLPTTTGLLTAEQEAELTVAFGEPVVLDISRSDRIVGFLMVWQYHLALIAGVLLFIVIRRMRARRVGTGTADTEPL